MSREVMRRVPGDDAVEERPGDRPPDAVATLDDDPAASADGPDGPDRPDGPDDDDPATHRGRRRTPGRRTLAAVTALALAVGAVAGFEEAQRRADRQALAATTLLAWTTGFDGRGWEGDGSGDDGLRLQVRLVALTGRPVTVTRLGDGQTLRLRSPVDLAPGYPTAVVVDADVRCTADGSSVARIAQATVRSERGREADVPVRVVARGLDSVVDDACADRVVEPATVLSQRALADGAVEVTLRAADGLPPSYLTVEVPESLDASWSVAVDPPGAIALIPGREQTYRFRLSYLRCTATGSVPAGRPPAMPDTRRVLRTSVVTGFTGDPRELAGWDDAVVAQAAVAAVARACG